MFSTLVESKPAVMRRRSGTIASFVAHYALILLVLYTSAHAETTNDRPRAQKVTFVETPKPQPPKTTPPELIAAPKAVRVDPVLVPPLEVPTSLPEIDLSRPVTDPTAFIRGTRSDSSATTATAEVKVDQSATFLDFQVEHPATPAPNSATPVYPDILRQAGVEGDALVSFVVDTSGRVDISTFKVVRATHDLFAASVRNALPRMRFIPAAVGELKVRQLVQQPFSFAIQRFPQ